MNTLRTTVVLPEDKLKELKKIAFERGSSVARLVNEALDKVFFKRSSRTSFARLRGIWKKHPLTDSDLERSRIRVKNSS